MRYVVVLLLAFACTKDADDTGPVDTDTDTDSDTDTDTDTDSDTALSPAEVYALCAAGGPISDGTLHGVMCLAPLDVASEEATDGTLTWKPGPIGRMYR